MSKAMSVFLHREIIKVRRISSKQTDLFAGIYMLSAVCHHLAGCGKDKKQVPRWALGTWKKGAHLHKPPGWTHAQWSIMSLVTNSFQCDPWKDFRGQISSQNGWFSQIWKGSLKMNITAQYITKRCNFQLISKHIWLDHTRIILLCQVCLFHRYIWTICDSVDTSSSTQLWFRATQPPGASSQNLIFLWPF